jgi:KaiC/GvpD/RAD55 family RecA-like ATPase
MKRSKTGIKGFDRLVQGGLPAESTILLCGTPGTAKSIFSFQYIFNGAQLYKEPSLFVSFEQDKRALLRQAGQFGWKTDSLEKQGLLHFLCVPVKDITHKTFPAIVEYVKKHKIKRLVIDSLSTLSINAPIYSAINELFLKELVTQESFYAPSLDSEFLLKRFIYLLMGELQSLPVTSILISEIGNDSNFLSRDTISEFLSDGVIHITFDPMGDNYSRGLLVRKMRHVKNDEDIHPMEISKKGIIIHDND